MYKAFSDSSATAFSTVSCSVALGLNTVIYSLKSFI